MAVLTPGQAVQHLAGQIQHGADGAHQLHGREAHGGELEDVQPGAQGVQAVQGFFLLLVDAQDVLTVDGRDEGLRQVADDAHMELVGLLLDQGDLLVGLVHPGQVLQHAEQQSRHVAQVTVLLQQHFEKRSGLGKQGCEHAPSS